MGLSHKPVLGGSDGPPLLMWPACPSVRAPDRAATDEAEAMVTSRRKYRRPAMVTPKS